MNNHNYHNGFKLTEIGWLPEEWEVVKLNSLTTENYKTIKPAANPNEEFEYYSIPAYQQNQKPSLEIGRRILSQKILLKNNAVLFGKLNPRVEKVWKVDSSSDRKKIGSTEWLPIFPEEKKVDSNFLYYLFWSNWVMPKAKNLISGSTPSRQRVNPKAFYNIKIPLPPLSEQKKIAAVLAAVQEAREKTEAVIAAVRELKKSLMKYLFTYGPVPVTEAEQVRLKETEIGVMPEEWLISNLEDILKTKVVDGTHKTPCYTRSGIPFITATNLENGKINFNSCKFITAQDHMYLSKRCKPELNDILLSKVGTLGLVAKVDVDFEFSIFVQVALLKPKPEIIDSTFLKYLLMSSPMQRQILNKASQSTMKYIGVGKIDKLIVSFPELEIQKKIGNFLIAIDQKISSEQSKKQALDQLFKSLLHNLMTGKVRVKHLEL